MYPAYIDYVLNITVSCFHDKGEEVERYQNDISIH